MSEHHHDGSHFQMATVAQKMVNILALNCPPNYHCGGPAYSAVASMDAILHLMGIGVTMLQRRGNDRNEAFEKSVHEHAVPKQSILGGFVQHKSQIVAGAIYAVLSNPREKKLREPEPIAEAALLSAVEWFLHKTGRSKDEFARKLKESTHDELIQLEKSE
jgi:hypothetical protein